MGALIFLAILVGLALWAVGTFNGIVGLENRVANSLAQVDVQLKRRNDLIPNLVETVKGYAAHESGVFEKVAQARQAMISAGSVAEKAEASNNLTTALRSVFAISEAYPELKANSNFQELQGQLEETENKITYSRQFFNDTVLAYNNAITTIPGMFFAGPMGKTPKASFQASEADRAVPSVKF